MIPTGDWRNAIAKSQSGPIVRCAHHRCHTSLTEDEAVQCPHGLTFCDGCTWEEACEECGAEAAA